MFVALLISCIAVVAFDAAAATISRVTGVAYPLFSIGSLALYAVVGYVLTQRFGMGGQLYIILVCTAVADATLGWWVSSLIGPGKPASLAPSSLVIGAFGSIMLGTVAGTVGAWIAVAATRMRG